MRYLLTVCLFAMIHVSFAQDFPQSWEGVWTGEVEIWQNDSLKNTFPMSLTILPTDSNWTYTINYQHTPGKPDIRKYSLVTIDATVGHYAIDENSGIILDSHKMGNCLYTGFGSGKSELLSRTCLNGEVLEYEISTQHADPERVSDNLVFEGDSLPAIRSYDVQSLMKASLRRKK